MLYVKDFSYSDYLTYTIKNGDTLKSVAEELGIDPYSLRVYHNKYCPINDLIEADFKGHLEYLIIESEESKVAKESHREKVRFSNKNFNLPFNPAGLNKNYLAMYTIENGEEKHSIKEEINVKWLNKDKNDYSLIAIDRISKVYVDEEEDSSMANELAEKTAKVFYPLEIVVDPNGEFTSIYNFEDIRERWQRVKKEVLKEFQGEAINESLLLFESKLNDNEIILNALSKDWFLRAFFNGINIEYLENLIITKDIDFPLSKKTGDIQFKVEQSIAPALDAYNLVNITQKGIIADSRSKYDFENDLPFSSLDQEEKVEGQYTAYYFLDPNKNVVESLFLECEIKLDVPQKTTIVISSLENEGKLIINSKESFLVDERTKESSNFFKVLWQVLRGK